VTTFCFRTFITQEFVDYGDSIRVIFSAIRREE